MKRVLFIQSTQSSFMNIDYDIIKSSFITDRLYLNQKNKYIYAIKLLYLLLCAFRFKKYDFFVVWFGDYHSAVVALIKRVLNKKMVLFIGGYDAIYYPDINVGVYNKKFRGFFCRYAVNNADLIIANHESLIEHANTYYSKSGVKSGLKNIIEDFNTPYRIIFNGINPNLADDIPILKEPKLVLTIGTTNTWEDFANKGYDLLIKAAGILNEYHFIFVSIPTHWLEKIDYVYHYKQYPNITIFPFLKQTELLDLYAKAQIYVQPSISEGMPNALMEAMLFECIPVGSNVAGIPTVIDKYGKIIKHRDLQELVDAIKEASVLQTGKAGSEYIKKYFNVERRANKILKTLENF